MSVIDSILRRVGLKGDPTSQHQPEPGKPALTLEEIQARLDVLRSPRYQALRQRFLDQLGVRIASAPPPEIPIEQVEIAGTIAGIFESDAARQKSQSAFFNDGARISSYMTGPNGVRLPRFTMPKWA
ncbi:MAG: hypothetical protein ABSG53_07165 [Thermoguttaceae bacterium]|jgi:hypothetical protein